MRATSLQSSIKVFAMSSAQYPKSIASCICVQLKNGATSLGDKNAQPSIRQSSMPFSNIAGN